MSPEISRAPEQKLPKYRELHLHGNESAWCVDGRPDYNEKKGPQMLGGSLHPILLSAIYKSVNLDEQFMQNGLQELKKNGYGTGVHRGSHRQTEENKSDCGFADKTPLILQKALESEKEIRRRLTDVFATQLNNTPFPTHTAEDVFNKLRAYQGIKLTGESLIALAESENASVTNVQGDHAESVAFVNLKQGTTFNTNEANQANEQAFNLDLWAATEQASKLGVNPEFAQIASLVLYQATEMVLVETNGKPALPVRIHTGNK